ncbi:hypothetical protein B0H12DRAFT_357552 [Mycena haematopus]|nr:hypothetical protein B0H12DRAFT_357552 [Mycena haematopus]
MTKKVTQTPLQYTAGNSWNIPTIKPYPYPTLSVHSSAFSCFHAAMLSSLAADRARVADLDAEIFRLERSLLERSLSSRRTEKARVQQRLDSYTYPVLELPNEITSEIFIHFLPIYPLCPPLIGPDSPILLTQICRAWRAIALGTPTLWRAISLPDPDPDIPLADQALLSDAWLSRSRDCPISVSWFDPDDFTMSRGAELLHAIVPYRPRLEHLVVDVSLPQLQNIQGPMPLLRRLELHLLPFHGQEDSPTTQVSFLEAPLLRTVIVNAYAVENIRLPWAQLTSLALHGFCPRECASILQHTFNLVHCELGFSEDPNDENVPDVALTLPSLQSLTLTLDHDDGNPVTGYLQTLIVPALRRLRVPEPFLGPDPIDTLASFMSKSCSGQLQELCVTGLRSVPDSSYRNAFPSTKVSFANWAMSFADWDMSHFD